MVMAVAAKNRVRSYKYSSKDRAEKPHSMPYICDACLGERQQLRLRLSVLVKQR
jgi:hypothetical protein